MNPYPSPFPKYDDGYYDDNPPSRQHSRQTIKSLFADFQTKPLPLPVWIWNCFVIYLIVNVAWLLIKIGYVGLLGVAFLFLGIFS